MEDLKINRKPLENDFGLISENCWRILCQFSVCFRFCHMINYLLTGLLVPYRKTLSHQLLHTDLASSVRTSKLRADYCLTKISIRAKRSISRVFSLFIVPSPFFVHCPYKGRINRAESVLTGLKPY